MSFNKCALKYYKKGLVCGVILSKNSEENLHVSKIVRIRNSRKITADYFDLDEWINTLCMYIALPEGQNVHGLSKWMVLHPCSLLAVSTHVTIGFQTHLIPQ